VNSITVFLILDLRFAILGAVPEGVFAFGGGLGGFERPEDSEDLARQSCSREVRSLGSRGEIEN
jgi:hypothetical protein